MGLFSLDIQPHHSWRLFVWFSAASAICNVAGKQGTEVVIDATTQQPPPVAWAQALAQTNVGDPLLGGRTTTAKTVVGYRIVVSSLRYRPSVPQPKKTTAAS